MKVYPISIPFNNNLFYLQLVKFLNFGMNLTDQEQLILSKLIEYNVKYKVLDAETRSKFIFSSDIRKEIYTSVKLSSAIFSQIMVRLKSKKYLNNPILNENNVLNEMLLIEPDSEGLSINIVFDKRITQPAKESVKLQTPIKNIVKKIEVEKDTLTDVEEEEFDIVLDNPIIDEDNNS